MAKPRIFVVENDAVTALNIKRSLEQFGYEVVDIVSADIKAVDKVREKRPDLVLVGIELARAIIGTEIGKQIYHQFDIPIIYLAAHSDNEVLQRAVQTEPFGYIIKPFRGETLLVSIETALHKHWSEKVLKESNTDLKAIFDASFHAHILVDRNGKIRICNKAAFEKMKLISGRPIERGYPIHELVPEEDREKFEENIAQVLQGKTIKVMQRVMSEGKEQWLQFYYNPVLNAERQVIGFCVNAMDPIELKTTTELLSDSEQRLLSEIQSVLFTTEELVNNANLENLLDFVTTQARHLTNADGVAVLLLSNDRDNLKVVSCSSLDSNVEIDSQLPVKGSIAEVVLATHKTEISSYPKDSQARPIGKFLSPASFYSLLCAPLKIRDKTLGVLLIWSKNKAFFNERDTPIIHLFANQAALALYNADLHIQNRELAIRQERHRLARELHDSVTQSLYSIGMAAQAALKYADQKLDRKAKNAVELIHALSQTALAEIRTHLHELRPIALEEKRLDKALEDYRDSLEKQFNFKVDLVIDANVKLTGTQVEHLYYIAKESLWNAIKHATTDRAKVVLTKDAENIILIIEDRGVGFVYPSLDSINSIGLRNLQERVELLAGLLTIQTRPGWGTQIKVQIPLL
ncbi:MAG TPA: histidine kinase [Anaerolineae bacterium]|nr:histidine kinase [Anaerolineae bacterium]